MASSKSTSKSAKAAPAVKEGRVTKPAQTPKSKSKDVSKTVAAKVELKNKKDKKARKVKEPTPESESESEDDSEDDSDVDDSEESADSDSDEEPAKIASEATKINGAAKKDPAADSDDSEDDSEDDSADSDSSDAESDEEPAAANVSKATTAGAEADDTSDESDSSEDEAPPKANGVKTNGVAKKIDAESSDEDEDDGSEGSGSSISDSEASDEEEAAPPKKRKADEPVTPAAKKSKTVEADTEGSKNLFVGNLSWNVDEEWLMREFEGFGELAGCRVITDRESGRSKGFGYVEFTNAADAAQALEEKNGAMVDGRNIRLDFSSGRTPKTENTPQQRAQRFGDSRSNPSDTLFIGNISFECTNDMVGDAFAEFGTITSVRLPTDRDSGQLKGFGYISFSSVEEAQGALDAMSGQEIAGRPIRLDFAGPRPDNGGAGGRGGRGGFGDRGGRGGRGGFGDRGGRGGGRGGGFRGGRGGRGGGTTNRGGFGDFQGKKMTF